MTGGQFLLALTIGTAALALWSYFRWPGAAPATITGAMVRIVASIVLLQVGLGALDLGVDAAPVLGILLVIVAVVPVLTFAFLASIWFMKVLADQMHGRV